MLKFNYLKFEKNCSKEKAIELISKYFLNGSCAIFTKNSGLTNEDIIEVYDKTGIEFSYLIACDDDSMIKEIKEASGYSLLKYITKENYKEINTVENFNKVILDIENLEIQDLIDVYEKNIPVPKYYNRNVLTNVIIKVINDKLFLDYFGELSEKDLEKFEQVDKNDLVGDVKCKNCSAFGICGRIPVKIKLDDMYLIGTVFKNPERCNFMRSIANRKYDSIDDQLVNIGTLRNILHNTENKIFDFEKEISNNNLLMFELSKAIIDLAYTINKEGGIK